MLRPHTRASLHAFLGAAVLGAAPALAQAPAPDPVRLDYIRAPGAETCPDSSTFRNLVAARFGGRDPFTSGAARRIALTLRRLARGGYAAEAVLYDGDTHPVGSRREADVNCASLVETMGLIVSTWLSPLVIPLPAPEPPPPPATPPPVLEPPPPPVCPPAASASPPSPDPLPPPLAAPPPAARPLLRLEAGPFVSFTTVPGTAGAGLAAGVGIRWPSFSIAAEVRRDFPASTTTGPAATPVRVSLLSAALAPCWHVDWFLLCGLLSGGVVAQEISRSTSTGHGAVGLRAGIEIPLPSRFILRASGDLLVPVRRPASAINGREIWKLPPVGETLGLRLVASF